MLVIEVREIFIQNKMGLVSGALLESRMVRLNMGIMGSDVARSVWATYRQIVEADFAEYFETRIFPDGIDDGFNDRSAPAIQIVNPNQGERQWRKEVRIERCLRLDVAGGNTQLKTKRQ